VSVRWRGDSTLIVSWLPPRARTSPATIGCYLVEYRTLGHWVALAERVAAVDRPSYRWTTASRRATYQFRVFSVAAPCRPDHPPRLSPPSRVVQFHTSGCSSFSFIISIIFCYPCTQFPGNEKNTLCSTKSTKIKLIFGM